MCMSVQTNITNLIKMTDNICRCALHQKEMFTLENIFNEASEEELSAIVHSIIGRLDYSMETKYGFPISCTITDKEIHEVVKGLRKPQ